MGGSKMNRRKILLFIKKTFIISFILVSILSLTLIGYDVLLKVENKMIMSNLGQFNSRTEWINSMKEEAIDEYYHMPRMMGNLGFPRLITQFKVDKNAPLYAWQTAGLLLGIYESTTEDEYTKIVNKRNNLAKMTGEEIDSAMLAYALSFTPAGSYADIDLINSRVLEDINTSVDANSGTIMYRKVYPTFRFADTIGLVCPFLARMGKNGNMDQYTELALAQIKEFEDIAFDEDYDYLPFHVYDLETETPLGKYGWGRGTGWYALGLIDTYSELEDSRKVLLQESIIQLAETLQKYQKEDGGWGSTVNIINSQTDTSATALFLYFIKRAGSLGVIEINDYAQCIERAEECLMDNTYKDGRVMNTEGECIAIGNYSYDYKYMPFTLGITLRAVCLDSNEKY